MQLVIFNQRGQELAVARITFITNHFVDNRIGGTMEIHNSNIENGDYECPKLRMLFGLTATHSASSLWNFHIKDFMEA